MKDFLGTVVRERLSQAWVAEEPPAHCWASWDLLYSSCWPSWKQTTTSMSNDLNALAGDLWHLCLLLSRWHVNSSQCGMPSPLHNKAIWEPFVVRVAHWFYFLKPSTMLKCCRCKKQWCQAKVQLANSGIGLFVWCMPHQVRFLGSSSSFSPFGSFWKGRD